jgi:UDP:flavonoid glycosyltransferase YjiC (YdhE family)
VSRFLLFPFANGTGLAHVGACLRVGAELVSRGHDVAMAYGGTLEHLARADGIRLLPVRDLTYDGAKARSPSRWYRDADDFQVYVDADIELMRSFRPDAVLSDTRLGTTLAAEAVGVPQVELMHSLSTMGYGPAPAKPGRWRTPTRSAQNLGRRFGVIPRIEEPLLRHINTVRTRYGLRATDSLWNQSGLVACTTTPELDPAPNLPENWRHVGPVLWSTPTQETLPVGKGSLPMVYVTHGSTGSGASLRRAVKELSRIEVDVLVTCAELVDPADIERLGPRVTARKYLPSEECFKIADVAVIHGGHLTGCAAHLAGVPVAVLPHMADQWSWAARVERLGTGKALPAPRAPGAVRRAITELLEDDGYTTRAAAVGTRLLEWNGPATVATSLENAAG